MSRTRLVVVSAWLGFALAGVFFYPLAAAIDGNLFYLQWEPRHATEAGAALIVLSMIFGTGVFATWHRRGRISLVGFLLIALLPLLSLGAGLSRQLPMHEALRDAWDHTGIRYGVPLSTLGALMAAFALRPVWLGRCARGLVLVISPIALVVAMTLVTSAMHPGAIRSLDTHPLPESAPANCPSVVALLFDELSFTYLYDGTQVRAEYPELRKFSDAATNFMNVSSPGSETLSSVPGFLAGRRFNNILIRQGNLEYTLAGARGPFSAKEPDGLFPTARRSGLSTEAVGYYLPYCELLGSYADTCRSFSIYNISTIDARFSPLHPILTTFILWPRQFPFGLLRGRAFGLLQRGLVEHAAAFALRPIDPRQPVFRFVHFSIPHEPFVYDAEGYHPPFDPMRHIPDDGYVAQTHYVDRLFGQIVAQARQRGTYEGTTMIVFADHGLRSGMREQDIRHVPFIVKKAGQSTREDVMDSRRGEILLRDLVAESCSPHR